MAVVAGSIQPKFIVFMLIFFTGIHCSSLSNDIYGTAGWTSPSGDIIIKYGEPLTIYCTLNEKDASTRPNASQHLNFYRRGKVLEEQVIINSTTIKLHIKNLTKIKGDSYFCIYNNINENMSLGVNLVYVGVPPQEVTDFSCLSRNLDNLTCTWTAPENYVNTTYELSYSPNVKTWDAFPCPGTPTFVRRGSSQMSCLWSVASGDIYRQALPDLYFSLKARNVFGNYSMPIYHMEHFKRVRPNAPNNLKMLNITWNSIRLSWEVPMLMQHFADGVHHRVLYQTIYRKDEWQARPIINDSRALKTLEYNLDNLEFAHTYYDIRVSMRSASADPNDESMWSDNATLVAFTASKKPDAPPRTNIGSFEIRTFANNADRNVRIYWSHIPEKYRNGENFSYVIALEGAEPSILYETQKAYILVEKLLPQRAYTFNIWARNEMGYSDEKSVVRVPAHEDWPGEPTRISKQLLKKGYYHLSWKPPELKKKQEITNYTIFWCNDEKDPPPCTGNLEWVMVPANKTSHDQSISRNKSYQFAISTNTNQGSSGMIWTHCTDFYYKDQVPKVYDLWAKSIRSDSFEVEWSYGCPDERVTDFIVFYCPIVSPVDSSCKGVERNITVPKHMQSAKIWNVVPYTIYGIQVAAVINHTSYSMRSERKNLTTSEEAPSTPPSDLSVTNYTNSTITISWYPPKQTNGILKYYKIRYNGSVLEMQPIENTAKQTRTLTHLSSYKNYSISVEACTIKCSAPSGTVTVQTKIGYPGILHKHSIIQNTSNIRILWENPSEPSGKLDLYQVRLKEMDDSGNVTTTKNVTGHELDFNCGDEKKYNSFYVSIRAVNLDRGNLYPGEWSDEIEFNCWSPSSHLVYVWVTVTIIFVVAMTFLFKKLYTYIQEMRNLGVKLPPDLQCEVIGEDLTLSTRTQKPRMEDNNRTADDEEHLLMTKPEGSPNLNGDSSGCSSAHESVTCSPDTVSNISSSTSDSGTEQPRTASTEDLNKMAASATSLRQRNIRPASKPYVVLPLDPGMSSVAKLSSKNYCILGVDPNVSTDVGSPYIPLPVVGDKAIYSPSEFSQSPPYVLTGELVKNVNPSYVPYKGNVAADVSTKSPPYVVAGNKDLLSPDVQPVESRQVAAPQESAYVKLADNMTALKSVDSWQPPMSSNTKTGYVSIGEVPHPKKETKGYVPHRQFDSKALKED